MAEIQDYKGHFILYGANETPSGLWEVTVTIGDADAEKTAKTLMINKTFTSEEDALVYALTCGRSAIDKILNNEKPDQISI